MGDSAYVTHLVEEGLADVALSRHVRNLKHCKQKLLIKEPYVCVCGPSSPLAALKGRFLQKNLQKIILSCVKRKSYAFQARGVV